MRGVTPGATPQPRRHKRLTTYVLVLLCVAFLVIIRNPPSLVISSRLGSGASACDPYSYPEGRLSPLEGRPVSATSFYLPPHDPQSPKIKVPSLTATLRNAGLRKLPRDSPLRAWAQDKSVMVLGDSIDRNAVLHLGLNALNSHHFHDKLTAPGLPEPDTQHRIGVARHESLNLTVYNFFIMSVVAGQASNPMALEPYFHPGEDMPQYFPARLEHFYFPAISSGLVPSPDMIVFNSGLWDLAYLGYRRAHLQGDAAPATNAPVSPGELVEHRARMRQLIRLLKRAFPKAKLVYRTMHLSAPSEKAEGNAMCRARIRQMESSNREAVKLEGGVEVMDWGAKVEGFEYEMEDNLVHFGKGAAQWLYSDMLLYHLKKLTLGDAAWDDCKNYKDRRL